MSKQKRKKRIVIGFILLLLIFGGGATVATIIPQLNDPPGKVTINPKSSSPKPQKPTPEIAEEVFNDVFCYCTVEVIEEMYTIAAQHDSKSSSPALESVGGQECLSGYYDRQADIVYQSSIFSRNNFHDPNPNPLGDINGRTNQYQYRDFYLKDGVYTYDMYNLDSDKYYAKPIIWRIHNPQLYTDVNDTNHYNDISGKPGYSFIRYNDRSKSWTWSASDNTIKRAIMVTKPSINNDIPFEAYAETIGIDLTQFIFIDIGG